ncbi:MAG: hypothetical protein R2715_01115 [Ilumatobacteraceae bacterium]
MVISMVSMVQNVDAAPVIQIAANTPTPATIATSAVRTCAEEVSTPANPTDDQYHDRLQQLSHVAS